MYDESRKRSLLGTGLALAMFGTSAHASLPALPADPLSDALERGDAEAVHRIEGELNAGADTRAMDDAQLRYDLPALLRAAINFEDGRSKQGDPGDLLLSLQANSAARASALSLGDANTFLKEALKAKEQLLPALTKAIGGVNTFDNGLDTADLKGAIDKAPKVTVSWKSSAGTLPFQNVSATPSTAYGPRPSIRIGGRTVAATVATDRPTFAPIWIIASPGDEKSSGLTLLVKNIGTAKVAYRSREYTSPIDLYLAPSIEFGPLVLHDVAVAVMESDFIPPETVVGMPMLRQFGEVTLGNSSLILGRTGNDICKSGAPLVLASGPDLNGSMLFPAAIDGKVARASFASDNPVAVGIKQGFNAGISEGREVDLGVGSWSSRYQAVVPTSWVRSQDAVLGGGLLKGNTVKMRFDVRTPSVCVTKLAPS